LQAIPFDSRRKPRRRLSPHHHYKQKRPLARAFLFILAEWTGLEPATPGVTGRYSNQLNYHSKTGPSFSAMRRLVGAERLELPTYAL
jgi:hypothetical protein